MRNVLRLTWLSPSWSPKSVLRRLNVAKKWIRVLIHRYKALFGFATDVTVRSAGGSASPVPRAVDKL